MGSDSVWKVEGQEDAEWVALPLPGPVAPGEDWMAGATFGRGMPPFTEQVLVLRDSGTRSTDVRFAPYRRGCVAPYAGGGVGIDRAFVSWACALFFALQETLYEFSLDEFFPALSWALSFDRPHEMAAALVSTLALKPPRQRLLLETMIELDESQGYAQHEDRHRRA